MHLNAIHQAIYHFTEFKLRNIILAAYDIKCFNVYAAKV